MAVIDLAGRISSLWRSKPLSGEAGRQAYWYAHADVRPIILAHAEKRVESLVNNLNSLNQRLASSTSIMFAGAAVAATLASNDKIPQSAALLNALSSGVFVFAGAVGCFGHFSSRRVFAGEPASWWMQGGIEPLTSKRAVDANTWVADHSEIVIQSLNASTWKRGTAFNTSIGLGAVAGVLIAVSALVTAMTPHPLQANATGNPSISVEAEAAVRCDIANSKSTNFRDEPRSKKGFQHHRRSPHRVQSCGALTKPVGDPQ